MLFLSYLLPYTILILQQLRYVIQVLVVYIVLRYSTTLNRGLIGEELYSRLKLGYRTRSLEDQAVDTMYLISGKIAK
jgi:hypothetical protein